MKDLVPLRRGRADGFEHDLLDAGAREGPSPAARARLWSALGAGTSVVLVSKAAEAAAEAAAPLTQAASSSGSGLLLASVGKWVGLTVVAGGLALGIVQGARKFAVSEPAAPPPKVAAAAARTVPTTPNAPAEIATSVAPKSTSQPVESPRSSVRAKARRKTATDEDGLARELVLLEEAKQALARGATGRSAALLDQHRRSTDKKLGPEAEILGIELCQARGDSAEAERRARAFLAAHPRSPHARRVQSLLETARASSKPGP